MAHIKLTAVYAMLDECAQGYEHWQGDHNIVVSYNGKIYNRLPSGAKALKRKEVWLGHVRNMVRHLGIDPDCASRQLGGARV